MARLSVVKLAQPRSVARSSLFVRGRFSVDGGLWSLMFIIPRYLPFNGLNGLPRPPHRRGSPPIAWWIIALRIWEPGVTN